MQNETKQKIAEVFQRNIDNRLSVELSNGMLQIIFQIIELDTDQSAEPASERSTTQSS